MAQLKTLVTTNLNRALGVGVSVMNWLQYLPSLAILLAGAMGYGQLLNRVKTVERDQVEMKRQIEKLQAMEVTLGRVDERTNATQTVANNVDRKLDDVISSLLREKRSFAGS